MIRKILPARMERIVGAVPESRIVCDVGCDHGMIGLALLEAGRCERVIFSDVSAESLKKAERLVRKSGFSARADFVCEDGLEHVETLCKCEADSEHIETLCGRADCAVIAGMGGREIGEIVSKHPAAAERFVLQPMKNGPELRDSLNFSGMKILRDEKIEDRGRFYDLIVAERGDDELTPEERTFGRTNLAEFGSAFMGYLRRQLTVVEDVLGSGRISPEDFGRLSAERDALIKRIEEGKK